MEDKYLYRLGEENYNTNGDLMKIVEYNSRRNIIVEFQDEYKMKNKTTYGDFCRGKVGNPSKKLKKIGEEKFNSQNCKMKIVEYNNTTDIVVEFQDEHKFKVHTTYQNFCNGGVRNPYHTKICGVACIGNTSVKENGENKKSYSVWSNMIHRCYDGKNKAYEDKYVCDEWLCFENFEKWFDENYYEIENKTMNLDKDILYKNNKVYSPDTCVFVPNDINSIIVNQHRTDKIIGVYKTKNKFRVSYNNKNKVVHLCGFKTEEEAFSAYKKVKEKHIKEIADEYKDRIPKKLYDAMYNWKVEEHG